MHVTRKVLKHLPRDLVMLVATLGKTILLRWTRTYYLSQEAQFLNLSDQIVEIMRFIPVWMDL